MGTDLNMDRDFATPIIWITKMQIGRRYDIEYEK
jgi:hypothetical protein